MLNALELFAREPKRFAFADMDELLDQAFTGPWTRLPVNEARFEVEETDTAVLLSVDLPGMKKEDLQIEVKGDVLTIAGERKRVTGRAPGRFERRFTLPKTIDVEHIEANLEDGVLTLALPKAESAKPRTIEVQSGKPGFLSRLLKSEPTEVRTANAQ